MIRFGIIGVGTMGRRYAQGIASGACGHRSLATGEVVDLRQPFQSGAMV